MTKGNTTTTPQGGAKGQSWLLRVQIDAQANHKGDILPGIRSDGIRTPLMFNFSFCF